jgi:hypothetical protein
MNIHKKILLGSATLFLAFAGIGQQAAASQLLEEERGNVKQIPDKSIGEEVSLDEFEEKYANSSHCLGIYSFGGNVYGQNDRNAKDEDYKIVSVKKTKESESSTKFLVGLLKIVNASTKDPRERYSDFERQAEVVIYGRAKPGGLLFQSICDNNILSILDMKKACESGWINVGRFYGSTYS